MKRYGLIGYPLTHSFSVQYFKEKFRREKITGCRYDNFPLGDIRDFPDLLKKTSGLCGLNVTIPYKESVIPYLDTLDSEALQIGAVNTIRISGGKTHGFNTDVYGFSRSLESRLKPWHEKALILGSGGAAKAVCFVLQRMGISFLVVSRNPGNEENMIGYGVLTEALLATHLLIINTTPLGTFPDTDHCPDIPYKYLTSKHLLYDLIYNPAETLFMKKGREKGADTVNGLEMLQLQAEKSWEIWNS